MVLRGLRGGGEGIGMEVISGYRLVMVKSRFWPAETDLKTAT